MGFCLRTTASALDRDKGNALDPRENRCIASDDGTQIDQAANMTEFKFNGKTEEVADGISIREFLDGKGIKGPNLILELNDDIIDANANLAEIRLKQGDVLNAFSLVGGG